jgi:hypothetical protein
MAEAKSGAILFNKRSLNILELPFPHEFAAHNDGWRVNVLEDGRLRARFSHGGQEQFEVRRGDSLESSGEDIYLSLQRVGPGPSSGQR